jgi:hypothetical protein
VVGLFEERHVGSACKRWMRLITKSARVRTGKRRHR